MNKLIASIFVCLFMGTIALGQYTQQITNVRTQARIYADAIIKKDYPTLMKYINLDGYPKGKFNKVTEAKALKIIQTSDEQMVQEGRAIKSIVFGPVLSIVKVNYEFQCTLEQIVETKMQYGTIITKSTLLAVSIDNGITWKYTDATGRELSDMRKIMPRLSTKLVFQKAEAPQFVKDPILKK